MSRKGNCWDNAVAESFFGSPKVEFVHGVGFTTREATLRALFDYIEFFYNRRRLHSALGYMPPIDYEAAVFLQRRVAQAKCPPNRGNLTLHQICGGCR